MDNAQTQGSELIKFALKATFAIPGTAARAEGADGNADGMSSSVSTSCSWKAQVGIFLVVAVAARGRLLLVLRAGRRRPRSPREQARLDGMRVEINKGLATARQLPEFRRQVGELQVRLDQLRAVLPEEKDVSDLLRRMQTLATQSNLQIKGFKPAADRDQADARRVADQLELDGTYHNLGLFFDRVSKFPRIINVSGVDIKAKDKPQAGSTITAACIATTYVLFEGPRASRRLARPAHRPRRRLRRRAETMHAFAGRARRRVVLGLSAATAPRRPTSPRLLRRRPRTAARRCRRRTSPIARRPRAIRSSASRHAAPISGRAGQSGARRRSRARCRTKSRCAALSRRGTATSRW